MAKEEKVKGVGGRPKGSVSKQSSRQRALKNYVLKHLDSHVEEAIGVLVEIMRNKDANPQTRVTAAKYVADKTAELISDILKPEDDGTSEDSEEKAEVVDIKPRLSLTVPTKKD